MDQKLAVVDAKVVNVVTETTWGCYDTKYTRTSGFCPNCGIKGAVWMDDCDDYYTGCGFVCSECGNQFHLMENDLIDLESPLIKQLKGAS